MGIFEALEEIQSRTKPYLQVGMQQGTFSNTVKAIRYGYAKPSTVSSFMKKFGYIKTTEQWEMKS